MRDRPLVLIALASWLLLAAIVAWIVGTHVDPVGSDFHGFYNAARIRAGWAIDDTPTPPNLSVPILSIILVPLAALPLLTAFWVWTGIGAAAIAASLWRITEVRDINAARIWFTAGALLVLMPCVTAWVAGQVTWVLVWIVTEAWASASMRRAGIWLGVAIALKPPLALMAILLPRRIWSVAGVTSMGLVLASVPLLGFSAWADWLASGRSVNWLSQADSVSFWGWAARLTAPPGARAGIADLPIWSLTIILVLAVGLAVIVRRAGGDRRWGLALIWSLWVSPLGWIYYLPVALGPMLSSLPASRAVWTALICLLVPWPVTGVPYAAVYLGSVLLLWIAWSVSTRPSDRTSSESPSVCRSESPESSVRSRSSSWP